MSEEQAPPWMIETVHRHIVELLQLAADRQISEQDHDMIGSILRVHIGQLIDLSPKGWETFVRFVNESRTIHYEHQS